MTVSAFASEKQTQESQYHGNVTLPDVLEPGASPDAENSWLDYQIDLEMVVNENRAANIRLGGTTQSVTNFDDGMKPVRTMTADSVFIQETTGPDAVFILRGSALRIGNKITTPALVSIGGQPATLITTRERQRQANTIGDVPVYAATWEKVYRVPRPPSNTIDYVDNPSLES